MQPVDVASRRDDGTIAAVGEAHRHVTADTPEGVSVALRSAAVVVAEATRRVAGATLVLRHGAAFEQTKLCVGYYAAFLRPDPKRPIDAALVQRIGDAVAESVKAAHPIEEKWVPHETLLAHLEKQECDWSVALLDRRAEYRCFVYCGWYCLALDHVTTPDSSICGLAASLRLEHEGEGFWIRFGSMPPRRAMPGLKHAFELGETWGAVANTRCLGDVNQQAVGSERPAMWIRAEEDRFTMAVAQCAQRVCAKGSDVKLVLISGPSAAGKTTFSHRLGLALRALGRVPTILSTDNYYRDASEPTYPKTEEGKPNHEVVECMRLDDFASDVKALFGGDIVETPVFDMKASKPKKEGHLVKLETNGVLVMEGIFAIDPKMTERLPQGSMFKIFIAPLPQTNADELTFWSHQEVRLLRRIARDYQHRGRDAAASIARGKTVREGEEKGILPNIAEADYVFNSTMSHELSVLQTHCLALLREVRTTDPSYAAARRLVFRLGLLNAVPEAAVPPESLLREFIGGSVFDEDDHPPTAAGGPTALTRNPSLIGSVMGAQLRLTRPNVPSARQVRADGVNLQTVHDALSYALETCEPEAAVTPLTPFGAEVAFDSPADDADEASSPSTSTTRGPPIAALLNSELVELGDAWPSQRGAARIDPVYARSRLGYQIHRATLTFAVHVAVKKLFPELTAIVLHGFGLEGSVKASAYYLELYKDVDDSSSHVTVTPEMRESIRAELERLKRAKAPVATEEMAHMEALRVMYKQGQRLAARMLNTCSHPFIKVHVCEDVYAIALQPLAPHLGHLDVFDIGSVGTALPGFALSFSTLHNRNKAAPPVLHSAVIEAIQARRTSVELSHRARCIADVNRELSAGKGADHVRLATAIDAMQLIDVANRIRNDQIRVVFVAGASSSGKSVFASRLTEQLQALGLKCGNISTDAYYRNLADPEYPLTPRGHGKDCECVEALLTGELIAGVEAVVRGDGTDEPIFDLGEGRRTTSVRHVEDLPRDGVLIVEGLFALDPAIRSRLDESIKSLGIMIAPLTVINLDEQRFVSAQVLRVLRRIVRDSEERGRDAATTIARWDSVSRGEARHAVPQLFEANVVVSASSLMELHQLAPRASALLLQVPPTSVAEYFEARQLLGLLRWVHAC
jgi:uridine kinase